MALAPDMNQKKKNFTISSKRNPVAIIKKKLKNKISKQGGVKHQVHVHLGSKKTASSSSAIKRQSKLNHRRRRPGSLYPSPCLSYQHPSDVRVRFCDNTLTQSLPLHNHNHTAAAGDKKWYLGGDFDYVKLVSSVEGDLDPILLSKLTAVPSGIGELALSVEAWVSNDDINNATSIVSGGVCGEDDGFDTDLLEKIANNTITALKKDQEQRVIKTAAKKKKVGAKAKATVAVEKSQTQPAVVSSMLDNSNGDFNNNTTRCKNSSATALVAEKIKNDDCSSAELATTSITTTIRRRGVVPNPLLPHHGDYEPVPNPLPFLSITPFTSPSVISLDEKIPDPLSTRITPPNSPTTTPFLMTA